MSERSEKAQELFKKGFNCSQSVFAAYADVFGIDENTALKISAGLGGGCGRQRELCGAVSGAVLAIGMKYGTADPEDRQGKQFCYEKVREFSDYFRLTNPSIVCRELLGIGDIKETAEPEKRTESYYKKRPCAEIVKDSAEALEKVIFDKEML